MLNVRAHWEKNTMEVNGYQQLFGYLQNICIQQNKEIPTGLEQLARVNDDSPPLKGLFTQKGNF